MPNKSKANRARHERIRRRDQIKKMLFQATQQPKKQDKKPPVISVTWLDGHDCCIKAVPANIYRTYQKKFGLPAPKKYNWISLDNYEKNQMPTSNGFHRIDPDYNLVVCDLDADHVVATTAGKLYDIFDKYPCICVGDNITGYVTIGRLYNYDDGTFFNCDEE